MSNYSWCCNSELTTDNCCCECGQKHFDKNGEVIKEKPNALQR